MASMANMDLLHRPGVMTLTCLLGEQQIIIIFYFETTCASTGLYPQQKRKRALRDR